MGTVIVARKVYKPLQNGLRSPPSSTLLFPFPEQYSQPKHRLILGRGHGLATPAAACSTPPHNPTLSDCRPFVQRRRVRSRCTCYQSSNSNANDLASSVPVFVSAAPTAGHTLSSTRPPRLSQSWKCYPGWTSSRPTMRRFLEDALCAFDSPCPSL